VSKFEPQAGIAAGKGGGKVTYTQVFGDWLCDMAAKDAKLVGITPAMREGSGLVRFAELYPERYVDAGIAEQHAVTFAAGLACEGMKPVVAIYSTFLQRGYDQLVHDVQLQDLPVLFALDRAGLVGADGATHHGAFDLSYLRCLPNMVVMAPSDENECRQMLYTGYVHPGPAAVRYPRGSGPGVAIQAEMTALPIGRAEVKRDGRRVALLAFGSMVPVALDAGQELDATVVNMRFVKPLDEALIADMATRHDLIVTLEENALMGGAGAAVAECLAAAGIVVPLLMLGLPDRFVDHGDQNQLLASVGLDRAGILAAIGARLDALRRRAAA
jgi:1-deoxy-D-xylulose-5-phosphate synthase